MRETATARIELGEDGVLIVRIRKGIKQELADARISMPRWPRRRAGAGHCSWTSPGFSPLYAETRHLYSGQTLVSGFTALALLVEASPLGQMMGNLYFRVARPGIPTIPSTTKLARFCG